LRKGFYGYSVYEKFFLEGGQKAESQTVIQYQKEKDSGIVHRGLPPALRKNRIRSGRQGERKTLRSQTIHSRRIKNGKGRGKEPQEEERLTPSQQKAGGKSGTWGNLLIMGGGGKREPNIYRS